MSDTSTPPRPSVLWKQLSSDRRQQAADAFWRDENAAVEHGEAVAAIAQRIKFRPKSVISLAVDKKARYLTSLPHVSELVAARLLVAYHLTHQRALMAAFLDALGMRHENGLIDDEDVQPPPADRLKAAVDTISTAYPVEDVSLYLSTLIWQDPDTWGGLTELIKAADPETSSDARA